MTTWSIMDLPEPERSKRLAAMGRTEEEFIERMDRWEAATADTEGAGWMDDSDPFNKASDAPTGNVTPDE